MNTYKPRTRRTPQERLEAVVLSVKVDLDHLNLFGTSAEPWMIDELREAEASIRHLRSLLEDQLAGARRRCGECGNTMAGRSDRVYCSPKCRQAGYRSRRDRVADDLVNAS